MTFDDAVGICHVRSAIFRTSRPNLRYRKNHPVALRDQVSREDQAATDWEEYDPRDDAPAYEALA